MTQELWSANKEKIYNELNSLAAGRSPVSLHDAYGHYAASRLRALVHRGEEIHLVLNRPWQLKVLERIEKIVYKRENSPFMFFDVRGVKGNEKLLSCLLPNALYYLQRRRFPRYAIKNRASVAFFLNRRAKVCHMELQDLSLGGARLSGVPRYDLGTSEVVGPATFSIASSDDFFIRELTINKAAVVRSSVRQGATFDVGLHFALDQKEKRAMADVLSDPFAQLIFR